MGGEDEFMDITEYVTIKELGYELGVCPKTLQNWRKQGMPFVRFGPGRLIRFDLDRVAEWIEGLE